MLEKKILVRIDGIYMVLTQSQYEYYLKNRKLK
jgi:hypothetical protein